MKIFMSLFKSFSRPSLLTFIVFSAAVSSSVLFAQAPLSDSEPSQDPIQQPAPTAQTDDDIETLIEIGATAGSPAVLNINTGVWLGQKLPLVFRISGGYWGQEDRGFQCEAGYQFIQRHRFRMYGGLTYSNSHITGSSGLGGMGGTFIETYSGVGPTVGINLYGFSLQSAVIIGHGNRKTSGSLFSEATDEEQVDPEVFIQMGYTFLL